jgi:hypothetical protein
MIKILENYLFHFIHPYQGGSRYIFNRQHVKTDEALAISWILVMLQTAYFLAGIHLGISFSEHFQINAGMQLSERIFRIVLFIALLKALFFPLWGWVTIQFWSVIIKFFAQLYDKEEKLLLSEQAQFIAASSLVSNLFLLVPILGPPIRTISSLFYIFAGTRKVLHFSALQSAIVIISPLLIMAAMLLLFIVNLLLTLSILMA